MQQASKPNSEFFRKENVAGYTDDFVPTEVRYESCESSKQSSPRTGSGSLRVASHALPSTCTRPEFIGQPGPAVTQGAPFEYDGAPGSKFTILMTNGKATMITEEVAGQRILSNINNGHAKVLAVEQNGTVLWSMGQKGKEGLVNAASARANAALALYLANPGIASSPQSAQSNAGSNVDASTAAPAPQAAPGSAPVGAGEAIHFDEANHTITVPRPDGVVVTFVGRDVKIAGVCSLPINYIIRYQKGSVSRFLERANGTEAPVGGTLGGGGEEFLIDGGGIITTRQCLPGMRRRTPTSCWPNSSRK